MTIEEFSDKKSFISPRVTLTKGHLTALYLVKGTKARQSAAKSVLDYLCASCGIPEVGLTVYNASKAGVRGTYHHYKTDTYCRASDIEIWDREGKTTISPSVFIDTLLHEFVHHYDYAFLHLGASPHTEGFYKRIEDLKQKIA